MPRKRTYRPIRRPGNRDRGAEATAQQRSIDEAARHLMASRSLEQLRSELRDRELLLAEADQLAQLEPSPVNLTRYRAASSEYQAIRRAVELAERG